jgi:asparagine synthase (glutamine-hydrolysing)
MAEAFRQTPRQLDAGPLQIAWTGEGAGCVARQEPSGLVVALQGTPWLDDTDLAARATACGLSDALAEGYLRYGEGLLNLVRGDFALAVVDPNVPRALVATDRFAARRMHVAQTAREILFGTVLDPIVAAEPAFARVSIEAIYRYLYYYAIPSPFTIYAGIQRLEPAQACVCTPTTTQLQRYWAPDFRAKADYRFEDARQELFEVLESAVGRVCGRDGKVGAFLSGGLDSSTVVGLMARQGGQSCFHVSFDAASFDESAYAQRAAEWFGLALHDIRLRPSDAFDILTDLTRHFDEPFGNSSAIPATLCARRARELGVTTMLAGDGGDEIFAGNERYIRQKKIATWKRRVPYWARQGLAALPPPLRLGPARRLSRVSELAGVSLGERILEGTAVLKADPENVLSPDFAQAVRAHGPVEDLEAYAQACPSENWLHQLLYVDMKYTLADNDLRKVGAACELAGVDVAYPMLDEKVTELALSVPPEELIRNFRLRHFFKEAVSGFLPAEIITKKKQGFGMPFANWLVEEPRFNRLADDALVAIESRNLLSSSYIRRMRDAVAGRGDRQSVGAAWDVVVLELWLSEHAPDMPA